MGLYLVIDPEEKTKNEILATIVQVDPQAQVVSHPTILQWRKQRGLEQKENATTKDIENKSTKLDFDVFILNFQEFSMLEWGAQLKLIADEMGTGKPYQIILIGYEDPGLSRTQLSHLPIFNFVFKPFDPLILKESLNALKYLKKRITPAEMKAQKSKAFVAVLKEIELQSISELGFVTLSEELIPVGSASKYFSSVFAFDKKMSAWAQCIRSIPHPKRPNTFINQFQFYGIESGALMNLRKFIIDHKQNITSNALWNLNPPKNIRPIKIALLALNNGQSQKLKKDLESHFQNVECDLVEFGKASLEKKQSSYDIVVNWSDTGPELLKKEFGESCKVFWILSGFVLEEDRKKFLSNYLDCFFLPIDRNYIYKKLKIHCPDLFEKEQSELLNIFSHEKMKSANLIQISEINELSIGFTYHRELPYKSFREFTLFSDDERNLVELQAFCVFSEKNPNDKSKFFHQFLFFAMTDHYLKSIRVWLLQDYVHQKEKEK